MKIEQKKIKVISNRIYDFGNYLRHDESFNDDGEIVTGSEFQVFFKNEGSVTMENIKINVYITGDIEEAHTGQQNCYLNKDFGTIEFPINKQTLVQNDYRSFLFQLYPDKHKEESKIKIKFEFLCKDFQKTQELDIKFKRHIKIKEVIQIDDMIEGIKYKEGDFIKNVRKNPFGI